MLSFILSFSFFCSLRKCHSVCFLSRPTLFVFMCLYLSLSVFLSVCHYYATTVEFVVASVKVNTHEEETDWNNTWGWNLPSNNFWTFLTCWRVSKLQEKIENKMKLIVDGLHFYFKDHWTSRQTINRFVS
jgi:hypothetical protein